VAQRLTRAERKALTREQLVEAALRCFEAQGFAATTLEQIAEEAGVTKGAVYSNFASKEDLFLEVIGREVFDAPDVSMLGDLSRSLGERFRAFGEVNAREFQPPIETLATWLEQRAFALRNERARAASADVVRSQMEEWGRRVELGAPLMHATPVVPGNVAALITQALLDGLRGLRAFLPDEITADVYGQATQLLSHLFEEHGTSSPSER